MVFLNRVRRDGFPAAAAAPAAVAAAVAAALARRNQKVIRPGGHATCCNRKTIDKKQSLLAKPGPRFGAYFPANTVRVAELNKHVCNAQN